MIEILVEPVEHLGGRLSGRDRREITDVGEQDRDGALLARENDFIAATPYLLGDVGRGVAPEELHELLALGECLAAEPAFLGNAIRQAEGDDQQQPKLQRDEPHPHVIEPKQPERDREDAGQHGNHDQRGVARAQQHDSTKQEYDQEEREQCCRSRGQDGRRSPVQECLGSSCPEQRRDPQIIRRRRALPDHRDLPFQNARLHAPGEEVGGGDSRHTSAPCDQERLQTTVILRRSLVADTERAVTAWVRRFPGEIARHYHAERRSSRATRGQ